MGSSAFYKKFIWSSSDKQDVQTEGQARLMENMTDMQNV